MSQNALQNLVQDDSRYYWDYLIKNPHSVRRKVAIQYAGRSGSYMLSGLLDGHSHILSFIYTAEFGLYEFLEKLFSDGAIPVSVFKESLQNNISRILDVGFYSCEVVAKESRNIDFQLQEFLDTVDRICENISQESLGFDLAYNIIYIAFGKTINFPLHTKEPILVIQRHVPLSEKSLKNAFDSLKNLEIIVTIRNPIKALDSHFFHHWAEYPARPWIGYIYYLLSIYKESLNVFYNEEYSDKGHIIFFEEMHKRPEETMRAFCSHFDIPYEAVLLQETLAGKVFFFNTNTQAVNGPSSARATDTSFKMLSKSDVYLIEALLRNVIPSLGYSLLYKASIYTRLRNLFPSRFEIACAKRTWQEIDKNHPGKIIQIPFLKYKFENREHGKAFNLLTSALLRLGQIHTLFKAVIAHYRDIRRLNIGKPYKLNFIRVDTPSQ